MSYLIVSDLKSDPDIAAALGEMVIAWGYAENHIMIAFSHAAKIDANMTLSAYYRVPTFEARAKVVQAILPDSKLPNRDAVTEAVAKLAKLAKARNHWIHGVWCKAKAGPEHVIFDYRQSAASGKRKRPVKAHDIRHHSETVIKRADNLRKLLPKDLFFA